MDTLTSRHGLTPFKPLLSAAGVDLSLISPELQQEVKRLEGEFTVTTDKLKEIVKQFREELEQGLENYGANLSMNVTWVLGWPDGHEKGSYLAVDLGGTNIRVCWIVLKERQGETEITQSQYRLSDELKTGSAEDLWSFVADSIKNFIEKQGLIGTAEDPLQLAFTFSYPAHQDYIDHGKLLTWTKGFDIQGVEGEDVAGQLREAMGKLNLPVHLVALINDTTGAMIASAYNDPQTIVGAIFGTGCNAAYMEHIGSITKLKSSLPGNTPMAINCEYGAFDNSHKILPRTSYDIQIDEESPRPGEQAFEKMSAGLYLGEIYRLVMIELHRKGKVFRGQDIFKLHEPYILDTGFLSSIENDPSPYFQDSGDKFRDFLMIDPSPSELAFSHRLAELIGIRGARLCTCGIAAICLKKGIETGHVAADGSVANKHPTFKRRWADAMGEVMGWPTDRKRDPISITSAEDGSGIGAAVIAAMTRRRAEKGHVAGIKDQL